MKRDGESDPLAETQVPDTQVPQALVETRPDGQPPGLAETAVDSVRPSAVTIASGTKIGRFTVIDRLGQGGMGVVVAAYDPQLDRRVAIKMLHDDVSETHGARLEREAKAMAQLSHPNVVTVHETGMFGDRLYIAMEHVEGQTFGQWLRAAPRSHDQVFGVLMQAGRGLAAAHAVGLVHRDFKPDNVLVGKDGRVRVSDFGLVSSAADRTSSELVATIPDQTPEVLSPSALTKTGAVMGTPLYMAPEQHGGRIADDKADQFSFCVTLWQALCDELPYGADTYDDLVANVTGGKLRAVPRGARVPAKIRAILARGLAPDPPARFPSMDALLAAIDRARRPVRWPWLAAGGAAIAAAGVTVALLAHGSDRDPCAGAEQRLAGVWDPARKARLADASWAPVVKAVDRYMMSWVDRHREVCRATHVRGEQSAELLDLRMHCLDDRLAQADALLARFSEASAKDAYRALDAVSGLSALADCDDVARLRAAIPPPADPAQRARLAELQHRLAEVESFDRMGQWKHARELIGPLEADARQLDYAPLVAKIVLLRAGEQYHDGDLDAAVQSYRDAAAAAAHARDDERIAQAWTDLVSVHAARGKYDEALALVEIARTSVERVSDHPLLGARLSNALAGIYLAQGKYPDAKVEYAKALELVRKDKSSDNELVGPALTNLGTALWYVGDAAGAAKYFEDGRAWFAGRYGPRHPSLGYIERNLGDLAAQKDDLDPAIKHYQESLAIFEGAHGPDHIDVAIALEPLCYAYARKGDVAKAREVGERALALREKKLGPDHPGLAPTLISLADADQIEATPAAFARAKDRLDRALALWEKAYGRDNVKIGEVLDRRATVLAKLGKLDLAYADLERGLALRVKAAGDHTNDTALAHMHIADVELELKKYAAATADYARAEEIFRAADPKDPDVARAQFGRAQVLAATGKRTEALALAKTARTALEGVVSAKRMADEIDGWLANR